MKKLLILILVFVIGFSEVFADEYIVSNVECVDAKYMNNRELMLKYDDEDDVYYLCRYTHSAIYWFSFTPTKMEMLRANIKKAQEWAILAKENKSTITKELPNSTIKVSGTMKRGNEWFSTRNDISLNFFFVSHITDEGEITTLLLRGDEEESRQNQFVDIEFESVVFVNKDIDAFLDAISPESISAAKERHAAEKKSADMFN